MTTRRAGRKVTAKDGREAQKTLASKNVLAKEESAQATKREAKTKKEQLALLAKLKEENAKLKSTPVTGTAGLAEFVETKSTKPPKKVKTVVVPQDAKPVKGMPAPEPVLKPTQPGPACTAFTIGQTLIARWDDLEGRHHAPARVEENNISWVGRNVKDEKGKGKRAWAWEGSLKLVLYRIGQSRMDLTLNWESEALIGPRSTVYALRLPKEVEAESIARVIAAEAERTKAREQAEAQRPPRTLPPGMDAAKQAKRAVQHTVESTQKIVIVAKTNPHKGKLAIAFSLFKKGMTVTQYLKAVADDERLPQPPKAYLKYELAHGFVRLEESK